MYRVCNCNAGYSCDECGKRLDENAGTMWRVAGHDDNDLHFCNETCTYKYLGIEPPKSQLSFPERPTVPKLDARETLKPDHTRDDKSFFKSPTAWACHCGSTVSCRPGHCVNVPA